MSILMEFYCHNCKNTYELWVEWEDREKTRCPKCGMKMRRLYSAPGLKFEGTGFYQTDYKDKE